MMGVDNCAGAGAKEVTPMKKLLLAVLLCPALLVGCRGGNAPTEPVKLS